MLQNLMNGKAVQGFDSVAFFEGKAVKGNEKFKFSYNNAEYLFESESNKSKFESDPEKYVPQYGGYCSIAMSEGALASPNPKSYLIQNDKLYLFTMKLFGIINVKRQWVKNPIKKQELADNEWSKMNS